MYAIYTPKAMQDMDAVWNETYEASKSDNIADKRIEEFIDMISSKKVSPTSGTALRYKGLFTGYYFINFNKYTAFYRIKEDHIEVLRIINSKRDYMDILFGNNSMNAR